jgi:hypothetical protein
MSDFLIALGVALLLLLLLSKTSIGAEVYKAVRGAEGLTW